jgi:hypothetical protein
MSRLLRYSALLLAALLLTTCGDSTGSDGPRDGWLSLQLTTPNTDDGGLLITVSGAPIDSVRTTHPHLLTRRQSESSMRVVISGNISSGVIGQILVPDARQSARYTVTIQEVAARSTYLQRGLTGYSISVIAPAR